MDKMLVSSPSIFVLNTLSRFSSSSFEGAIKEHKVNIYDDGP